MIHARYVTEIQCMNVTRGNPIYRIGYELSDLLAAHLAAWKSLTEPDAGAPKDKNGTTNASMGNMKSTESLEKQEEC
jgi:hypothetical protein